MTSPDEDALSWAGDEDRLVTGAGKKSKAECVGASDVNTADSSHEGPAGMSSVALVGFGILAGIYLLYSVAWLITALRNPKELADVLSNFMFHAGVWMCVAAPALWFGAVLFVLRGKKLSYQFLWLIIGVIVLLPWPYVTWVG